MRNKVKIFAEIMEKKLKENDHKRHWASMSQDYLLSCLKQETKELQSALINGNPEAIQEEAVDVANFAMMIADNCGGLWGPK